MCGIRPTEVRFPPRSPHTPPQTAANRGQRRSTAVTRPPSHLLITPARGARNHRAPSAGFEPAHTAPEADALSPELRGREACRLAARPRRPVCGSAAPARLPDRCVLLPTTVRRHCVLGPLLRYVDESRATIWCETDRPCEVDVLTGAAPPPRADVERPRAPLRARARRGPAAVRRRRSTRSSSTASTVWPLADSAFPPSVIRTPDPDAPFRLAFGSCRRSAPFDDEHLDELGADALVALAGRMVDEQSRDDVARHPADARRPGLRRRSVRGDRRAARRRTGTAIARSTSEIHNFEEYTWLYHEAWMTPTVRWLLSTVPTGDDARRPRPARRLEHVAVVAAGGHVEAVVARPGRRRLRLVLGVPAPRQPQPRAARRRRGVRRACSPSTTTTSARASSTTWPGRPTRTRRRCAGASPATSARGRRALVAIDSRCSRHLDPDDRRMVDAVEWAWVRGAVLDAGRPHDHLVLASTLPFLLLPGVHHMEGWDEAIS